MKKILLSAAMLAGMTLGAQAINVDDVVFSTTAKYKVTGADLVTNGNFANLTDGWKSLSETPTAELFNLADGGGSIESASQFDTTQGIYQMVKVPSAGSYVVTMKLKGSDGSFTDIDLAGAGQNYITALFGTEEDVAAESNVIVGQTASFGSEWTELTFGFNTESDGNVFIVLKNLASGVAISDVELHSAKELFDTRIAERKLAVVNTYLNGFAFNDSYEGYTDLKSAADELQAAIANNDESKYETLVANLDGMWDLFLPNLTDVLYTINGAGTGNNCANWMEWTSKYNKNSEDDHGTHGWAWSTDRWCHKTAEAGTPLQIQWMRGSSGAWDNIATNTCTLDKGTYFFQFDGSGGMMTLNKNWWTRSLAVECAVTQMFFQNDTIDLGMLCPYDFRTYVHKFEVAENGTEVKFGIRCNIDPALGAGAGFDIQFINPSLYKVNVAGELTEEEKAYIKNVNTQLDALDNKIKTAQGEDYLLSTAKPWNKALLKEGIAKAEQTYADYSKITQDEMIDAMYNDRKIADEIMNEGVRDLQNNYMNVFNEANKPLTDMPNAITSAENVLTSPIYGSGDKDSFRKAIDEVSNSFNAIASSTNDEKMEADVAALEGLVTKLNDATDAFKKSAEVKPFATFDFENGYEKVVDKDADGEDLISYVVKSTEGTAKFVFANGEIADEAPDAYSYPLTYQISTSKSPAVNEGNYLLIGTTEALVDLTDLGLTEDDILRVDMTVFYPAWGNTDGNPEFNVLDEAKEKIAGFKRGKWNAMLYNSFGYESGFFESDSDQKNYHKLELKDCFALTGGSRVDYQFVIDFKLKEMFANVTQYYGNTGACEVYAETYGKFMKFADSQNLAKYLAFKSGSNNSGRRASMDNLKIYKYKSSGVDVQNAAAAVKESTAVKTLVNGAVVITDANGVQYNAAGAQK